MWDSLHKEFVKKFAPELAGGLILDAKNSPRGRQ
jgi:hypothetical protein